MLKKKNLKIFLFIFFFFIITINLNQSKKIFAYEIETHAYLTKEIVNFYNQINPQNKIDEELIPFLIDGSRREDEPPRWLNHFYDPLYNRGLVMMGIEYPSSRIWAQSEFLQNSPTYKISATIASILTAIQQKKISALSTESTFVWEKAIKQWIQGSKEEAMFTLGHILHLLQDLAVPDHTRNDLHPEGSIYEKYVLEKKLPIKPKYSNLPNFEKIDEYFYALAKYSNENFYSKNTITSQELYPLPGLEVKNIESLVPCGEYQCKLGKVEGITYKLLLKKPKILENVIADKNSFLLYSNKQGGDLILSDYWSLLSVKAVEYGTGVINLFFKEVERNKNNPEFNQKEKGFLAHLYEIFNQFIEKIKRIVNKKDFQEIAIIPKENSVNQEEKTKNLPNEKLTTQNNKYNQKQINSLSSEEEINSYLKETEKKEFFLVTKVIDGDTIILENNQAVRYLGIDAPEFSENGKVECLGREARDFNAFLVSGKRVSLKKDTNPSQEKDNFGRLLRYVYLENSKDKSVNQMIIEEGLAYSYNFNRSHSLEDIFEDAEKIARQNQKGIWSPNKCLKKENLPLNQNKDEEDSTLPKSQEKSCSFSITQSPQKQSLIFNEIAWMGTTQSASDEWIEIKNISSQPINLSGWQIIDKNEDIKINLKEAKIKTLPSGGLLLLERTDDNSVPNVPSDLIYKGSLANSEEGLKLFDPNCNLVDEVLASPSWPAGDNSSKRTMERNQANLNWYTSSVVNGTPRQENSPPYQENINRGGSNEKSENNQTQNIKEILINEIMYNPNGSDTGREWIELYNAGTQTIKITDLKLNENNTNHRIEIFQGSENLAPGQYAVIADNPQKFLEDFPDFRGNLFDSSFSLNNNGEIIKIIHQENTIDQYQYSPEIGANGNGKSLQRFEDIWQEANPTPGQRNKKEANQDKTNNLVNHLLISEVQIKGESPDDEFIEIYNPTTETIFLSEYSIQYLSGQAVNFENVSKKNFETNHQIKPLSFFLLANSKSKFASQADLTFSFSLSGAFSGGGIFLVKSHKKISQINDPNIVDAFFYGKPKIGENSISLLTENNQSFERKTVFQNQCLFAKGNNEFLGNNCDTNNSAEDFYIRDQSLPQNTSNLPEPRKAPTIPQNLSINFDKESFSLNLTWQPSENFLGNSSEISYQIIPQNNFSENIFETQETKYQISIDEVEEEYSFSLRALDKDKMPSEEIDTKIFVPGLINNLSFFKHPLENQYLIEIKFEDYPFIPSIYPKPQQANGWKAIVFYLNKPALKEIRFNSTFDSQTKGISNEVLSIKYLPCAGNNLITTNKVLFLADNSNYCRYQEGAYSFSLNLSQIEDKNIILPLADFSPQEKELNEKDFISIAYYASENYSGLAETTYKLIAIDKRRFFFNKDFPFHQSPSTPTNFQAKKINGENDNNVILSWDNSIDPDSLDSKITYQVNYHKKEEILDSNLWQVVQKAFSQSSENGNLITTQVEPKIGPLEKGEYIFYLRAQDEMGLLSEPATFSLKIEPLEIIAYAPLQSMAGNLSFKTEGQSIVSESKIAQSFSLKEKSLIKEIKISLSSSQESPSIQAKISLQSENDSHLPSENKIIEKIIENINRWTGEFVPQTIAFDNPIQLNPGKYFLVIESQGAEEFSNQHLITPINNKESYPEEGVYSLSRSSNLWSQHLSWFNDQPFLKDIYFEIKGTTN